MASLALHAALLAIPFGLASWMLRRAFRDPDHAGRWFALATGVGAAGLLVPVALGY
ncbi:MAG: hypothetical protein ABW136_10855 [Steroidobacteraceae bacterium]